MLSVFGSMNSTFGHVQHVAPLGPRTPEEGTLDSHEPKLLPCFLHKEMCTIESIKKQQLRLWQSDNETNLCFLYEKLGAKIKGSDNSFMDSLRPLINHVLVI